MKFYFIGPSINNIAVGTVTGLLWGNPPRRTIGALAITVVMTMLVTALFMGLHVGGLIFDLDYGILLSEPPQFGGWRVGWFNTLWLLVIGGVWAISLFLSMRHVADGGGVVGLAALVSVVPMATVVFHRMLLIFHEAIWPTNLHNMRPTWDRLLYWTVPRMFFLLFLLMVGLFAFAWLVRKRKESPPHSFIVIPSIGLGAFLADLTRPVIIHGRHLYPNFFYIHRDPVWYWLWEMIQTDLYFYGRGLWYASVAAIIGWLLLTTVRWSKTRHGDAS